MTAYSVNCYEPGPFTGFYATVTASPGGLRGTGYAHTERAAISAAWREYWRKERSAA